MAFLLIVVLAGVQAEARWNGAQRMQKVMTKAWLEVRREEHKKRGQIYDIVLFSCLWNSAPHVSTMFWSNLNFV